MANIKRVSGQVTIYAALSFMVVVSLIIACVQYATQTQMFAELDMSTRMSIESVFAGYHNPLQQEFNILALSTQQCSDEKFQYYASRNIDGMANVNHIQYRSAFIQDKRYMTDNNGEGVEQQILLYMKNNIYTNIINQANNIDKLTKKSETLHKLTDEMMDLDKQIVALDQSALKLIELIEGLKTDSNGIILSNGLPELIQGGFAKQIILKDISMEAVSVYNNHVYHAITLSSDRYMNVNKWIDDLMDCIELYGESLEEDDISEANSCIFIYENNIEQFYNTIDSVKEKSRQAMDVIETYNSGKEIIYKRIDKCENDIKESQDILDTDILNSLLEEIDVFKEGKTKAVEMFLVEDLWENLNDNYCILKDVYEHLKVLRQTRLENTQPQELEELKKQYDYLKAKVQGISNEKLVIDYSNICFDKDNKGLGGISQIQELLTNGIADVVLADFSLCEGKYDYNDLAESYMSAVCDENEVNAENIINEGFINQYITNQFLCFTDIQEKQQSSEEELWCSLGYPLEYVVAGEKSDKANISEIILKLSVLREGMNIAYIMTDSDKRSQAQALAISLMGFTGNAAIVKAAQFLIMGVWAYGESVVDIRRLFQGEEISFLKTKEDWKLSLQNLLSLHFESSKQSGSSDKITTIEKEANSKTSSTKRWSEGKLNYKDYLTILLMTMDKKLKLFRTMSVMELRMIALGDVDFRMNQYVYQATGTIGVQYGDKKLCERSEQYGYI